MARAIDLLPAELKPFFEHYRAELVVRVVDPDVWRNAGWEEDHNHFVDFGMPELGPYPFTALPREYGAALEKFGMTTLKKIGMLPWREAEQFGNLRRAFEGFAQEPGLRADRRRCCFRPWRRTTSRTPISRCTPPTTTTGS